MEKKYLVGGLAVLGVIAVVAYLKKPKRNSEGFFNAYGTGYVCVRTNADGSRTVTSSMGDCPKGSVYKKSLAS